MISSKRKIYYSNCDLNAELSISGAVSMIQDNIAELFLQMGCDNIYLNSLGAMWIFVKNQLKFYEKICWNDDILVKTYPIKASRVKCVLETVFVDSNKKILAVSKMDCCILNKETFKIEPIANYPFDFNEVIPSAKEFKIEEERLELTEGLTKTIKSDMIDYSNHVNNSEYLRFVIQTFSTNELKKLRFNELQINYLGQALEGDKITIYSGNSNSQSSFCIKSKDKEILKVIIKKTEV